MADKVGADTLSVQKADNEESKSPGDELQAPTHRDQNTVITPTRCAAPPETLAPPSSSSELKAPANELVVVHNGANSIGPASSPETSTPPSSTTEFKPPADQQSVVVQHPASPLRLLSLPTTLAPLSPIGEMPLDIGLGSSDVDRSDWPTCLPLAYKALIKLSSNESWHKLIHEWIRIEKSLGYPGGVHTKFFTCNITDSMCFSLDQIGFHLLDVRPPLECGSRRAVILTSNLILRTIWIPTSKSGRNGIVVCSHGGGLTFLGTLRLMRIGRRLQRGVIMDFMSLSSLLDGGFLHCARVI